MELVCKNFNKFSYILLRNKKMYKGKGSVFTSHSTGRISPCKLGKLDQIEREGYIKGVVKDIVHYPGRGAPLAKFVFCEHINTNFAQNISLLLKIFTLDNIFLRKKCSNYSRKCITFKCYARRFLSM